MPHLRFEASAGCGASQGRKEDGRRHQINGASRGQEARGIRTVAGMGMVARNIALVVNQEGGIERGGTHRQDEMHLVFYSRVATLLLIVMPW